MCISTSTCYNLTYLIPFHINYIYIDLGTVQLAYISIAYLPAWAHTAHIFVDYLVNYKSMCMHTISIGG